MCQRGERAGHLGAGLTGPDHMPLALDAEGLPAAVQGSIAVPLRVAEVLGPVAAAVDAAMLLVDGLEHGAGAEVHGAQVGQHRSLVVLDGCDRIVGAAVPEQAARCHPLGVHGVRGDDAPGDIRQVALWLGHASLRTTEMYLRVDPASKLEILTARQPPDLRKGSFDGVHDELLAMLGNSPAR